MWTRIYLLGCKLVLFIFDLFFFLMIRRPPRSTLPTRRSSDLEYYFLLLTAFLGCLLMPRSRDLLMLFISLELVSAPGFLIAAFRKSDPRSNEAGIKFFLIGVLSTAVMLYGMSLIYGVTGSLDLAEIGRVLGVRAVTEG